MFLSVTGYSPDHLLRIRPINSDGTLPLLPPQRWSPTHGSQFGQLRGGSCSSTWRGFFVFFYAYPSIYFRSRTRFRREANKADNKAATVAVDSLINFEAVKVGPPPALLSLCSYYTLTSTSTTRNTRSHNMISI